MTKTADKLAAAVNKATDVLLNRFSSHNKKIKKIVEKPIDKKANGWTKSAQVAQKIGGVGGRVVADTLDLSGVLVLFLSKAFVKMSDTVLFDNKALDFMEKKFSTLKVEKTKSGKDKKIPKFTKENPRVTAYLGWYLMLLSVLGGIGIAKNKDKISDAVRDKIENVKNASRKTKQKEQKETINTFKIDPTLPQDEWMAQVDAIWPYIYMETILSEGFVNEAYADVGETSGYITIGSGYMIGKAKPKGKKDRQLIQERKRFFRKVLGKPYTNGVSVSFDENRMLVRAFYEAYIWPHIKNKFTTPIDAHLFIQLCIGAYNRGSGIYGDTSDGKDICKAINGYLDSTEIVNRFDDLCKRGYRGLEPKYGVAAHRVLGNISDEDVLNSYANSVYGMRANKLWDNGRLKEYPNVASDLVSIVSADISKNGKTYNQLKLNEYLTPDEVMAITNGNLFRDFVLQPHVVAQRASAAEKLNEQGEKLYFDGKYQEAIHKFNQAIREDPRLFIVYSNMAISYYQMGKYERGLEIINNFISMPKFDYASKEIKGYTYFNGALCYEKLGDEAKDITEKLSYYNKAKEYVSKGEGAARTKYKSLRVRLKDKSNEISKSKTSRFNKATETLKTKAKNKATAYEIKNNESRI